MALVEHGTLFSKRSYQVFDTLKADLTPICKCKSANDAIRIMTLLNLDEGYTVRPILDEAEALASATHRHYKGGLYKVLRIGAHTETKEELVVYEHLWPHKRSTWIRPKSIWDSLTADGQVRFTPIGDKYIHHVMKSKHDAS
jgi:hypothetical protein